MICGINAEVGRAESEIKKIKGLKEG